MAEQLFVGFDAGGSSTLLRAQLTNHSESHSKVWNLSGPRANPLAVGVEKSARVMCQLINEARDQFPHARFMSVCGGVAGAYYADLQDRLAECLQDFLDPPLPHHLQIVHDSVIALEASFGAASGLVVIAGTGSIVIARTEDGAIERAGGMGYLLGDEGSGFMLGRAGIRCVLHALDGGPATLLQDLLEQRFNLKSIRTITNRVYVDGWPLQEAAEIVLEAVARGDRQAQRILAVQTSLLAAQISRLARQCPDLPARAVLFGGLSKEAVYVEYLRKALQTQLPAWTLRPCSNDPVQGALQLARRVRQAS